MSAALSGIQLLLGCDLLGKIKTPLEDYRCNAMASRPRQASEWNDAEDAWDACDSYPSLPAVEAVLDALEVESAPQNCSNCVLNRSATWMFASVDSAFGQRRHMLWSMDTKESMRSGVQACTEEEEGVAAMGIHTGLLQLLAQLIDPRAALLVRGRAAVLLSILSSSGATAIFAEVCNAPHK